MRVHLAVLVAVCTPATSNTTACFQWHPLEGMSRADVERDVVGPLPISLALSTFTAASDTAATSYCAGWEAGWSQGWKDVKGSHVPSPTAPSCPSPICGSEKYDDGFARGRTAGQVEAGA